MNAARYLVCEIVLLSLLALPGCGDDAPLVDSGAQEAGTCSPATCTGCCEGAVCKSGQSPLACGKGGATCVGCNKASEACARGACVPGSAKCNANNCSGGCCQGDSCVAGNLDDACGKGGGSCQRCGSTQKCQAQSCTCTPGSCDGCCDGQKCRAGNERAACGTAGNACIACKTGEVCLKGSCKPSTGCLGCLGCCDGALCRAGTDTKACGLFGAPCTPCKTGELCNQGVCNNPTACGPGKCTGCCRNSNCNSGTTPQNCGSKGGLCVACASKEICAQGACTLDPQSKWSITVVKATIDAAKKSWDLIFNTAPDPYVAVEIGSFKKSTAALDNTYTPNWGESVGVVTAGEILTWNIRVTIFDEDFNVSDETVGTCTINVPANILRGGTGVVSSCPHPDGNNYVTHLEFKFTAK